MLKLFDADLNIFSLWKTLASLMGRSPATVPAGGGSKSEEPLQQQITSAILPNRNDESILMAIDAAGVLRLKDGPDHIKNILAVRLALEKHQQDDWRKNIGNIKLTERFEVMLTSETVTRGGNRGGGNQAGAGQSQGGQERTEHKWERFPLDYEWKAADPRVRHLVLVSTLVDNTKPTLAEKVAEAKAYLISGGFINALSPAQRVAAATEKGTQSATNFIHSYVGDVKSSNANLIRLENAIETAVDAPAKRQAEEALRAFLVEQSRAANARRQEKDAAATLRFRLLIVIVVIGVIAMAVII